MGDRPICRVRGLPGEGPCLEPAAWWVRMGCRVSPLEQVVHPAWGAICPLHLVDLINVLSVPGGMVCTDGHGGRPFIAEQRAVVPGQGPPPDVS